MAKETFVVNGMTCASCVANVENAVNKLDGVDKAVVNLTTEKMSVDYAGDKVSLEAIEKAVVMRLKSTIQTQPKARKSVKKTRFTRYVSASFGHLSSPFLSFILLWAQWLVYLCQTSCLLTMQP